MWGQIRSSFSMGGETAGNGTPRATFFRLYVQKQFLDRVFRKQIPGLFPPTLMRDLAIALLKVPGDHDAGKQLTSPRRYHEETKGEQERLSATWVELEIINALLCVFHLFDSIC